MKTAITAFDIGVLAPALKFTAVFEKGPLKNNMHIKIKIKQLDRYYIAIIVNQIN